MNVRSMTRRGKSGFTMAELLIVVAIIAVLVAIAIPVFSTQLEKSRETTDMANLRSAYAEAVTKLLSNESGISSVYKIQQHQATWAANSGSLPTEVLTAAAKLAQWTNANGEKFYIKVSESGDASYKVEIESGDISSS